jgi:hypothetical protein
MAFAQLTYRESLRDIETCLRALGGKLYPLRIRGHISRSTLADANETRDWRIFADLAGVLITMARPLYTDDPLGVELEETAYALDCTTIDLCLSLFSWARYRRLNAAVKMHTLLDLRGNIPVGIEIKPAKIHEIRVFDQLLPEPGAFYLLDHGYLDFTRLYPLTQCPAFFIIRARKDFCFRCVASHAVDKSTGLRCNQTIRLGSFYRLHGYPENLRRIHCCDQQTEHASAAGLFRERRARKMFSSSFEWQFRSTFFQTLHLRTRIRGRRGCACDSPVGKTFRTWTASCVHSICTRCARVRVVQTWVNVGSIARRLL